MGNQLFFCNIYGHIWIKGRSIHDSYYYYGEGHSLERRKEALDKVSNFHKLYKFI